MVDLGGLTSLTEPPPLIKKHYNSLTCSRNAENPISKELIFKNCVFGGPYLEPPFLQFCISPSNACVVFMVTARKHAQFSSIIAFVFAYIATKRPPFDLIVLLFPQNTFFMLES